MYGQKVGVPDGCDNGEGSYLFQHEPTSDLSLAPSSTVVSFDDITIYRIGGGEGLSRHFTFRLFGNWGFSCVFVEDICITITLPGSDITDIRSSSFFYHDDGTVR